MCDNDPENHSPDPSQPSTATRYSLSAKIKCLTLMSLQSHPDMVHQMTGIPRRTQLNLKKTALERGWDGTIRSLEDKHVIAGKATGRPRKKADTATQPLDSIPEDKAAAEDITVL